MSLRLLASIGVSLTALWRLVAVWMFLEARHLLERVQGMLARELRMPEVLAVSALRNLVDNALRYSPATSRVILNVEWQDDKWVCFTVLDEGPCLTEAECAQALERFWRRDATRRRRAGQRARAVHCERHSEALWRATTAASAW